MFRGYITQQRLIRSKAEGHFLRAFNWWHIPGYAERVPHGHLAVRHILLVTAFGTTTLRIGAGLGAV
jgi:hypothetical protein